MATKTFPTYRSENPADAKGYLGFCAAITSEYDTESVIASQVVAENDLGTYTAVRDDSSALTLTFPVAVDLSDAVVLASARGVYTVSFTVAANVIVFTFDDGGATDDEITLDVFMKLAVS